MKLEMSWQQPLRNSESCLEERRSQLNWLEYRWHRSGSDWSQALYSLETSERNRQIFSSVWVTESWMVLKIRQDYYNFERMNLPEITQLVICRILYITEGNLASYSHVSSSGIVLWINSWFSRSFSLTRSVCSVVIRTMRPTVASSTKSKGLVVGTSPWQILRTLQLVSKKDVWWERQIRLRPSYFPFTEPSVEVDVFLLQVWRRRL